MNKKKLPKSTNYLISYTSGSDREILTMMRAIAKYVYDCTDKLLKSKPKTNKWEWKSSGKKK